jgi:hypothetical protein
MPYMSYIPPMVVMDHKPVRTIHKYDFTTEAEKLRMRLYPMVGTARPYVKARKKSKACTRKIISKRRSKFTGVTKNSANYQTLIVLKGKKIYVGSYPLEINAAITFDLYSLIMHGDKATPNFDWTVDQIIEMLNNFIDNKGVFEPERLNLIHE